MKKIFTRAGIAIVITVAVLYTGALVLLKSNETAFIYFPTKATLAAPPDSLRLGYTRVALTTPDQTKLVAWRIPASATDSTGVQSIWVLYFHGNGLNVSGAGYVRHYANLHRLGVNVFAAEYRGYGESGGEPNESGLNEDALTSYRYLTGTLHIDPKRIFIYGYSLGSGVAIELASKVQAAGLIVEGAYLSIGERGQAAFPYFPVKLILSNKFASIDKIGSITAPKLFIHAVSDQVIPISDGRTLFAAASAPKTFLEVNGGHATAYIEDEAKFYRAIETFISENSP
ncbi:MAG: alpha/beta hydrolase [Rhizobacter sp.]|nr:alpha/beta hydrolase [Chlorobiales bacterium]